MEMFKTCHNLTFIFKCNIKVINPSSVNLWKILIMSTWCSSNTTINFNVIYNKFNEWMCSVCIGSNRDLHTHIYGTHCLLYPLFYSNSLWENIITKTSDIWMLETFTQDLNESLLTFPPLTSLEDTFYDCSWLLNTLPWKLFLTLSRQMFKTCIVKITTVALILCP